MSVVAMIVTPTGRIYAAHDSIAADSDGSSRLTSTPKIVRVDGGFIGFVGSWSLGRRAVIDYVQSGFDMDRFVSSIETTEDDWTILIARFDQNYFRLIEISADRSVIEIAPEPDGYVYHAVGAGAPYALGLLAFDHEDPDSVIRAVESAAKFTTAVRAPVIHYKR